MARRPRLSIQAGPNRKEVDASFTEYTLTGTDFRSFSQPLDQSFAAQIRREPWQWLRSVVKKSIYVGLWPNGIADHHHKHMAASRLSLQSPTSMGGTPERPCTCRSNPAPRPGVSSPSGQFLQCCHEKPLPSCGDYFGISHSQVDHDRF